MFAVASVAKLQSDSGEEAGRKWASNALVSIFFNVFTS